MDSGIGQLVVIPWCVWDALKKARFLNPLFSDDDGTEIAVPKKAKIIVRQFMLPTVNNEFIVAFAENFNDTERQPPILDVESQRYYTYDPDFLGKFSITYDVLATPTTALMICSKDLLLNRTTYDVMYIPLRNNSLTTKDTNEIWFRQIQTERNQKNLTDKNSVLVKHIVCIDGNDQETSFFIPTPEKEWLCRGDIYCVRRSEWDSIVAQGGNSFNDALPSDAKTIEQIHTHLQTLFDSQKENEASQHEEISYDDSKAISANDRNDNTPVTKKLSYADVVKSVPAQKAIDRRNELTQGRIAAIDMVLEKIAQMLPNGVPKPAPKGKAKTQEEWREAASQAYGAHESKGNTPRINKPIGQSSAGTTKKSKNDNDKDDQENINRFSSENPYAVLSELYGADNPDGNFTPAATSPANAQTPAATSSKNARKKAKQKAKQKAETTVQSAAPPGQLVQYETVGNCPVYAGANDLKKYCVIFSPSDESCKSANPWHLFIFRNAYGHLRAHFVRASDMAERWQDTTFRQFLLRENLRGNLQHFIAENMPVTTLMWLLRGRKNKFSKRAAWNISADASPSEILHNDNQIKTKVFIESCADSPDKFVWCFMLWYVAKGGKIKDALIFEASTVDPMLKSFKYYLQRLAANDCSLLLYPSDYGLPKKRAQFWLRTMTIPMKQGLNFVDGMYFSSVIDGEILNPMLKVNLQRNPLAIILGDGSKETDLTKSTIHWVVPLPNIPQGGYVSHKTIQYDDRISLLKDVYLVFLAKNKEDYEMLNYMVPPDAGIEGSSRLV